MRKRRFGVSWSDEKECLCCRDEGTENTACTIVPSGERYGLAEQLDARRRVGLVSKGHQQVEEKSRTLREMDLIPQHIAEDGSLMGIPGRNAASGWAVRMDEDQEEEPWAHDVRHDPLSTSKCGRPSTGRNCGFCSCRRRAFANQQPPTTTTWAFRVACEGEKGGLDGNALFWSIFFWPVPLLANFLLTNSSFGERSRGDWTGQSRRQPPRTSTSRSISSRRQRGGCRRTRAN